MRIEQMSDGTYLAVESAEGFPVVGIGKTIPEAEKDLAMRLSEVSMVRNRQEDDELNRLYAGILRRLRWQSCN